VAARAVATIKPRGRQRIDFLCSKNAGLTFELTGDSLRDQTSLVSLVAENPIRLFRTEQGHTAICPRNGTGLEATGPGSTLHKETCGIERLAPERRSPRPASEEGKLELTEALRSNDRS
jgi:hypothetical protein